MQSIGGVSEEKKVPNNKRVNFDLKKFTKKEGIK